ncbi:MAG: hypothetical protein HY461_00245 [Parcubacteria group bacterium]|nr:hypothetical protein [Parcubacteria group bacterium]
MEQGSQQSSLTVSLLLAVSGWLVAAIVVVWFFAAGKPAYYLAGFAQGSQDQNAADKARYEQALGLESPDPSWRDTINIRVVRIEPGAIIGQEIIMNTNNPFTESPRQQTIRYDNQTRIVRRVVVPPAEFEQRLRAAQANGENPMTLAPFDDMPADISVVKPGDRLEVMADDQTTLNNDSFYASLLAVIVSSI